MTRLMLTALFSIALIHATALTTEAANAKENNVVLRHVVLFKWKEDTSNKQIRELEQAFAALPKKIDAIKSLEWGTNNSPEGLDQGFTHCFLVTFADEEGRAAYLPHPEHKAFVELMKPHLDKVLVLDYWTGKKK